MSNTDTKIKQTAHILLVFMKPYPPKRLTEIKVYYSHLVRNNWNAKLFVLSKEGTDEDPDIISVDVESHYLVIREILFNLKLLRYIIGNFRSLSHIYIFHSLFLGAAAIIISRILGLKVICDFRSVPIVNSETKYRILVGLEKLNFTCANSLVAIDRNLIERKLGRRFLKKAVELPEGYSSDLKFRQQRRLRAEKWFVLPTTLEKPRNLPAVLDAFKNLDDCHLFLYGDGEELATLKSDYGGWPNIHLMGHCRHEELMEKLSEYDCGISFIPITRHYEFQPPLKTIEYLGAGLPVIATNTYGNRVYVNEENGVLIDDTTEALRKALIEMKPEDFDPAQIRGGVERFQWDRILEPVFEHVFGR